MDAKEGFAPDGKLRVVFVVVYWSVSFLFAKGDATLKATLVDLSDLFPLNHLDRLTTLRTRHHLPHFGNTKPISFVLSLGVTAPIGPGSSR